MPDGFRQAFLAHDGAPAIAALLEVLPRGGLNISVQRLIEILVQHGLEVVAVHHVY